MTEQVNHPSHYNQGAIPIETIEIIDLVTDRTAFDLGNAIKYICRAPYKGSTLIDLEKALWYIDDFIKNSSSSDKTAISLSKFEQAQLDKICSNLINGTKEEEYSGTILKALIRNLSITKVSLSSIRNLIAGTIVLLKEPKENKNENLDKK